MRTISGSIRSTPVDLFPFWYPAHYHSKKHGTSTATFQTTKSWPLATRSPTHTACSQQIPPETPVKIVHGETLQITTTPHLQF